MIYWNSFLSFSTGLFSERGILLEKQAKGKVGKDCIVVGFALFSMFFGAGNVVFPPYLGMQSGTQWLSGFLFYFIADIGLAMMALFAILRNNGPEQITGHIGRIPSAVLMSAIILCIGPMLAIPRTAATTYEMSIAPLTSAVSPVLFSVLFFAVILLLSVKESAVVDIVGKVLTPLLLIGLMILIVKGVVTPLGKITAAPVVSGVAETGIRAGYQTMDVLAAMAFGIIILKSAQDKGYADGKSKTKMISGAALLAGGLLLLVYLGLTYLGATVSGRFNIHITRAELVIHIVDMLLGRAGTVIFGVVVALACMTTAVALVSSSASFFEKLCRGKVKYSVFVIVICVFSAVVSNLGLDRIVAIASPVLDVVYPPTLVLIVLSIFGDRVHNAVHRSAVVGALLTSLLNTVSFYGLRMPFLQKLPLASLGLGWVVPAVVFGLVAFAVVRIVAAKRKPGDVQAE